MMILAFFQRALKDLSATEFTVVMQVLPGVVRAHPLNYELVTASTLAPVAALVALRGSAGEPAFVFGLASLVAFVAGPVLVSQFFAERTYDVFPSWKPESPPEDWRVARNRHFRLNAVRGLGPGAALVLFLAGLVHLYPAREEAS